MVDVDHRPGDGVIDVDGYGGDESFTLLNYRLWSVVPGLSDIGPLSPEI